MKRRTKLILLMAVLGCLGGIGAVLSKIAREAGEPFPGAVAVLDDASWRACEDNDTFYRNYLWANADTILYRQQVANGYQVVRRRIQPNKTVTAPETLPIVLRGEEYIDSLSPNGTMLCINKILQESHVSFRLVRTNGKGKPVILNGSTVPFNWLSDSKFLFGYWDEGTLPIIKYVDVETGKIKKTTIHITQRDADIKMTSEGILRSFGTVSFEQNGKPMILWIVIETHGSDVVRTSYQKPMPFLYPSLFIAPNGKRLLWALHDTKNSLLEKIQNKLFRKNIAPHMVLRYSVTDIEGKNERWIGEFPLEMQKSGELNPKWTPDGKGVHFVYKGKLMYLAVP